MIFREAAAADAVAIAYLHAESWRSPSPGIFIRRLSRQARCRRLTRCQSNL